MQLHKQVLPVTVALAVDGRVPDGRYTSRRRTVFACLGKNGSCRQENLVRPSATARAAVHHRNVGTVRLLRHAGAADAVPDQAFPFFRPAGDRALRRLYRSRIPDAADRRPARRPISWVQTLSE